MATVEGTQGSVEAIRQVLSYLLTERRKLRSAGADDAELEANRLAIAAMQWRLGRAARDDPAKPIDSAAATS